MPRIVVFVWIPVLLIPAASAHADHWQRSFDVTARPVVRIRTDDGRIQVERGAADRVEVEIETRGWDIGDRDVTVNASQHGNDVEVVARTPRFRFSIGFHIRSLRIFVRTPEESDLDLESGDGSIHVESVSGQIDAQTSDGSIVVKDATGELSLRTGDGSIRVTGVEGSLYGSTHDGRIRVQGRFDALDLESGDGSIRATAERGSRIGRGWSLKTGDGSMVLWIPEDMAADLDARTGDGRITVDIPVSVEGEMTRSRLRGSMNGGGPPLRLRSGDGSIRIERAR